MENSIEKESSSRSIYWDKTEAIYHIMIYNIKLLINSFNTLSNEIKKLIIMANLNYINPAYRKEAFERFFCMMSYLLENIYYYKNCLKEIKKYLKKSKSNQTLDSINEILNILIQFKKIYSAIDTAIYYEQEIWSNGINGINYYSPDYDSSKCLEYTEEVEKNMILFRSKYEN